MTKTNTIQAAVAKRAALETEIASSQKRLAETGARIPALAAGVNLDDASAMAELGRMHLEVSILPTRISVKEENLQKADAEILETCCEFVSGVLNPKQRELEGRARAKTRAVLKEHLPAGAELDRAVETATLVREIAAQNLSLESNPHDGPAGYARRVLAAWQATDSFAGKL